MAASTVQSNFIQLIVLGPVIIQRMKSLSLVKSSIALFSSLIVMAVPATALAARPTSAGGGQGGGSSSVLTGNDISWPQCGQRLPSGQAFGIVGVNGGIANEPNSCFAEELQWAQGSTGGTGQDSVALYVNTGNPGDVLAEYSVTDWPSSGYSDKYGTCSGTYTNDAACAYQYGKERAMADVQFIGSNDPASFKWWLDVETGNSWSTNTANNVADLEGMVDYFESIGVRGVGLYSTSYQWGLIAGTVDSSSSLYGLDSWLPGASNLAGAQAKCSENGLTGGQVTLAQYVAKRVDYDFSCI